MGLKDSSEIKNAKEVVEELEGQKTETRKANTVSEEKTEEVATDAKSE